MIPGSRVIPEASSETLYRSQFLPATISTESLTDWPDRLVPAARNVTGTPDFEAAFRIFETSLSFDERSTILGTSL